MNQITHLQDTIPGSALVAKADDLMRLARKAFEAESQGHRDQERILSEIDAVLPMLPEFEQQIRAGLRPASGEEITAHVAVLLRAFPNVRKDDGAAFGRLLLEDAISQKPSVAALEAGCTQVRRTSRFLPSIAEVLDAIRANQNSLTAVLGRIHDIRQSRQALEAALRARSRVVSLTAKRNVVE